MTYYIIRQKSTGAHLSETRGAYTGSEPTKDLPPRLFSALGPAKCALAHWLQGACLGEWEEDIGRVPGRVIQPGGGPRDPDDFEVISVRLMGVLQSARVWPKWRKIEDREEFVKHVLASRLGGQGRISAIKIFRAQEGAGLMHAKMAVECCINGGDNVSWPWE